MFLLPGWVIAVIAIFFVECWVFSWAQNPGQFAQDDGFKWVAVMFAVVALPATLVVLLIGTVAGAMSKKPT